MMDVALAIALETNVPVPVRRPGWVTRHEDMSRDTSLPDELARWFVDDITALHTDNTCIELLDTALDVDSTDVFSVLDRLANLGDDWNGEGARPPAPVAISNAGLAAMQLEMHGLKPMITADVDGGVMLTLRHPRNARHFAALSCDNDGDTYLILEGPPETPFVRKVDDAEGIGPGTLGEITQFLSR